LILCAGTDFEAAARNRLRAACVPGWLQRGNRIARIVLGLMLLAAVLAGTVSAAEMEVKSASLAPGDDGYVVKAEFAVGLTPRLEDIVAHGVSLYFVAEFELTRPRWYWLDEVAADKTRTFRVYYHALTRQYRVSYGPLHQSFSSLADALSVLDRISEWQVADKGALKPGQTYQARIRIRLDPSQLPKPLQVTAIGSRDLSLGSDWFRFDFTAPPAEAK
jgi:hypothetical protein